MHPRYEKDSILTPPNQASPATVAELMGHLPETNENFYNFDITELEYKKNMVSELWNESFRPREFCVLEKV